MVQINAVNMQVNLIGDLKNQEEECNLKKKKKEIDNQSKTFIAHNLW